MASVEYHNLWSFDSPKLESAKCSNCHGTLSFAEDSVICSKCKLGDDFTCGSDLLGKEQTCCRMERELVAYCFHCSMDLCDVCLMEHQYMKLFENHNILHFKNGAKVDMKSATPDSLFCCLHKSEILRYFCKTCNTLICEECAVHDHPKEEHDFDYVEQDLKIKLKQEILKKGEMKLNQLKMMDKLIENQSTQLMNQFQKIQSDIKDTFCFFYSVIEDRKEQLLKELENIYAKKVLPLTLVNSQISEALQLIETPSTSIEEILINPKNAAILEKIHSDDFSELVKKVTTQSLDLEFLANYQAIKVGVHNMFGFLHSKSNAMIDKSIRPPKDASLPNISSFRLESSMKPDVCDLNSFAMGLEIKNCKKIAGRSELLHSPGGLSFTNSLASDVDSLPIDIKSMLSLDGLNKYYIKREKMIYYNKIGEFGILEGQFAEPSGVAVNARNEILVADTNNHRIQVFDENGKFRFKFGEVGRGDGQFFFPNRVAVAPKSGDIVITERNPTHQVQVYNQYGQFVRKFGADVLQHPRGITVDHEDRIVIVECKVMKVVIFDMYGKVLKKFGCSKYVEFPNGVAVNDKEEIFISDNRAHCVKVFNYDGIYLRQIGGEGLTNYPISVCINRKGEILIADNHSSFNITIFTQDGQLIKGLESKAKHVQCFDTAILDEGSIVLASKDFRLYLYRYNV